MKLTENKIKVATQAQAFKVQRGLVAFLTAYYGVRSPSKGNEGSFPALPGSGGIYVMIPDFGSRVTEQLLMIGQGIAYGLGNEPWKDA